MLHIDEIAFMDAEKSILTKLLFDHIQLLIELVFLPF